MRRPAVVLAMGSAELAGRLFDHETTARLHEAAEVDAGLVLSEFTSERARISLASAEVLLTGWGCPVVDAAVLDAAPQLRAVVHAAGTVKEHIGDACWDRGIRVATAADANAVPVAEFTLAAILFAGKRVFDAEREYRRTRAEVDLLGDYADIGNHHRTVGIVGASRVGRLVLELLRPFTFEVLLTDPYVTAADAVGLGSRKVELMELARRSGIISLHAPSLPATQGIISRDVLAVMPDGATLINTARGALVDEGSLASEVASGRLRALLDVTSQEPLPAKSPLWDAPGVVLTPHIAGAAGNELHRLGEWAVDEIERFARGEPFRAPVVRGDLTRMA